MTLSLIFQIGKAAIDAAPGAYDAFMKLKAAHDSGSDLTDADLDAARLVLTDLNRQIQAA